MANYNLYADVSGVRRAQLIAEIQKKYPDFDAIQMSYACKPERYALQLIPAAEELLVRAFGSAPGLAISPKLTSRDRHGNKNKPNRLCVRVDDNLRSRIQAVYEKMCFASMQDLIEAALSQFADKYERGELN